MNRSLLFLGLLATASPAWADPLYLDCSFTSGHFAGRRMTFALDLATGKAKVASPEIPLRIVYTSDTAINTNGTFDFPGLPAHDLVGFNFNRVSATVEGFVTRNETEAEMAECRRTARPDKADFCGVGQLVIDGDQGISRGSCTPVARKF